MYIFQKVCEFWNIFSFNCFQNFIAKLFYNMYVYKRTALLFIYNNNNERLL